MEHDQIRSALRQVAHENGVTVNVVYQEIQKLISFGIGSQDPRVRKRWEEIPNAGKAPTLEELIDYLLRRMREM